MPALLIRTPGKAAFLLLSVLAVWFVPYHFAVQPSISLSYVVGYNNRVAFVLFVASVLTFAGLTQGRLARGTDEGDSDEVNQKASTLDLWLGIALALFACLLRHHHAGPPKSESAYMINRLQMLASGVHPYTGFEFVYGPLQLYGPLAISKLFRCSIAQAFYVGLFAQWLLGVWVLWGAIKLLPLRLRRRRLLFWVAFTLELPGILNEGAAYTPLRMAGPVCLVLLLCAAWHCKRSEWLLGGMSCAVVLLEFSLFPEQGLALAAGLLAWLGLRVFRARTGGAFALVAGCAFAFAGMLLLGGSFGVFNVFAAFASGAYSLPLVPSVPVALLLFAYVAGACCAMQAWRAGRLNGPELPLALCGFAALPSALGRCDLGHLQLASPLLFLGVAYIETLPAVRRFWSPLTLVSLVLFLYGVVGWTLVSSKFQPGGKAAPMARLALSATPTLAEVTRSPCALMYRAPTVWPAYDKEPGQMCMDTGYYAGMLDVLTPAAMAKRIDELTAKPRRPLLMSASSLQEDFDRYPPETQVLMLFPLEQGLFFPKARNAPLTYAPVIRAIEENYTPGPVVADGLQVWEPKAAADGN